jgi:hypothetical protein
MFTYRVGVCAIAALGSLELDELLTRFSIAQQRWLIGSQLLVHHGCLVLPSKHCFSLARDAPVVRQLPTKKSSLIQPPISAPLIFFLRALKGRVESARSFFCCHAHLFLRFSAGLESLEVRAIANAQLRACIVQTNIPRFLHEPSRNQTPRQTRALELRPYRGMT